MLTAAQIYALARAAGFPPVVAVSMTAIALRESGGNAAAYNGNLTTRDQSYGLWQINMHDAGVAALIRKKVLVIDVTAPGDEDNQLFIPAVNARAAFVLWDGHNKNLSTCWYINRPGMYQDRYESHLPAAQAAAIAAGV